MPEKAFFSHDSTRRECPSQDRPRRCFRIDHAFAAVETATIPPNGEDTICTVGVWCRIAGQAADATILRPFLTRHRLPIHR